MEAPTVTGHRLGIIAGSALPDEAFAPGATGHEIMTDRGPVHLLDTGSAIVLHRHGVGPSTPAHRVDHHRNITALCAAGCDRVVSLNSVGSLRLDWPVGTLVAIDDFVAPCVAPTFFDDARGHSVPGFHTGWRTEVLRVWHEHGATPLAGAGVYVQTTGPRFETPAEIRMLATFGDVVGMTVASEAILAREAGLAYAALCMIDNLANGLGANPLTVDEYLLGRDSNAARLLGDLDIIGPVLASTAVPPD